MIIVRVDERGEVSVGPAIILELSQGLRAIIARPGELRVDFEERAIVLDRTAEICKVDDIWFQNLDNHNAWIDEESRPEDMYSTRDWMWREVWHIDKVKKMFPEADYPNMEFVREGGNVQERIDANSTTDSSSNGGQQQSRQQKKHMTEIFFYENQF